MPERELDHHLGYDKQTRSDEGNTRNGYGSKTIKTDFNPYNIHGGRDNGFKPVVMPKQKKPNREY